MARIEETCDDRDWYMIECDDPDCEQRFDDGQWQADEDDLLADAKDDGWQILYRDEHPELERDMHEHHDRSGRLEGRAMPRMHQGGDLE